VLGVGGRGIRELMRSLGSIALSVYRWSLNFHIEELCFWLLAFTSELNID
jgi:hypothetical protein